MSPFFILLIDGSSSDLSGDKGLIRVPLLLELLLNLKYVFLDQNRDIIYTDFTPMHPDSQPLLLRLKSKLHAAKTSSRAPATFNKAKNQTLLSQNPTLGPSHFH
jgi:hypothetical protein